MDRLLTSRKHKEEHLERIEKLSPEKYGKGAYYELTYTPSKLADNILYREASYMKKIEEETCTSRELESQNKFLSDQIANLRTEKEGIETSLNKMIEMYKLIITQMESKNEERIKNMQVRFKEEMSRRIVEKDEEARFTQSEKELLEQQIN